MSFFIFKSMSNPIVSLTLTQWIGMKPGSKKYDWSDFYRDAKEALPPDAPPQRGASVQSNGFVDADHAGNKDTCRSQTGILVCLNCAPILLYSKAQNMAESSIFGSEFIAMRISVELLEALRCKLCMFGIGPISCYKVNHTYITIEKEAQCNSLSPC